VRRGSLILSTISSCYLAHQAPLNYQSVASMPTRASHSPQHLSLTLLLSIVCSSPILIPLECYTLAAHQSHLCFPLIHKVDFFDTTLAWHPIGGPYVCLEPLVLIEPTIMHALKSYPFKLLVTVAAFSDSSAYHISYC
jgi:hypothetical protein